MAPETERTSAWAPVLEIFRALTWRYYRLHPLRFLLCMIGVAAGVAVSASIRLTNDRVIRSFNESVDALMGRSSLHVSFPAGLKVEELDRFRFIWQAGTFSPCIRATATPIGSASGMNHPIRLMAFDFVGDYRIRRYLFQQGGKDESLLPGRDAGFSSGHALVVPVDSPLLKDAAQDGRQGAREGVPSVVRLMVGSTTLALPFGPVLTSINGRIPPVDVAYVDIGTLIGAGQRINCMDVLLDREGDGPGMGAAIREIVPSAIVETPTEKKATTRDMLAAFQMNLAALGYVALLVSAFLVYNTMSISVLQRDYIRAVLSVQGAREKEIFSVLLLEGAFFGLTGSLFGVAAGYVLANWASGEVSLTLANVFHSDATIQRSAQDGITLAISVLGGIAFSLLAALYPAWKGSRFVPVNALRRAPPVAETTIRLRSLVGAGLALGLFLFLAWLSLRLESVSVGFVAVGVLMIVLSSLAPAAVLLFISLYHWLPGLPEARLAGAELRMHIGRLSVAAASLAIALSMAGSITIMVSSFRSTVEAWLQTSIAADIYLSPDAGAGFPDHTLEPELLNRIRTLPFIADTITVSRLSIQVEGKQADLYGEDLAALERLAAPSFVEGGRSALARAATEKGVIVSEVFAQKFHKRMEDRVEVFGAPFTILGIARNFSSERGALWMDSTVLREQAGVIPVNAMGIYLRSGADPVQCLMKLRQEAGSSSVIFSLNREIRSNALTIFDRTFHMTRMLQAIAAGIASLAFFTTLLSLNLEQKRVMHTLLALGVPPASCAGTLLLQSVFMALSGLALALPGSILFSWMLIHVINRFSFGWTIVTDVPWATLAASGLVVLVFATLAAILPARALLSEKSADVLRARE